MPQRSLSTLPAMACALLAACQSAEPPAAHPPPPNLGMANPASVFCVQQGGTLRRLHTAAGEHGVCVLRDGREVEEWALFRQHHPSSP